MSDLVIDYQLLQDCSASLTAIHQEFDGVGGHEKDLTGIWGSSDIAHAMDDFAGNWDYHRKKILGSIESLGTMVDTTVKAFQDADKQLKDALTPKK